MRLSPVAFGCQQVSRSFLEFMCEVTQISVLYSHSCITLLNNQALTSQEAYRLQSVCHHWRQAGGEKTISVSLHNLFN